MSSWFFKEEFKNSSPSFTCHSLTCSFSAKSKEELEQHWKDYQKLAEKLKA